MNELANARPLWVRSAATVALWSALILYPFALIWQGGDLTDTGFFAFETRYSFDNLRAGYIDARAPLTFLTGGLWWLVFPSLGVLGLSIFGGLVSVASAAAPLSCLRRNGRWTLLALFAAVAAGAFNIRNGVGYSYTSAPILFLMWALVCMCLAAAKSRLSLALLAGALVSIACFFRISSAACVLFAFLPVACVFWDNSHNRESSRHKLSSALKLGIVFFGGFASATAGVLLSFYFSGIWDAYRTDFGFWLTMFGSETSYGGASLTALYLDELRATLFWLVVAMLWGSGFLFVMTCAKSRWMVALLTVATCVVVSVWVLKNPIPSYMHPLKYLAVAFYGAIGVLLVFRVLPAAPHVTALAAGGIIIAVASFAGSNTGFLHAGASLLAMVPACTVAMAGQTQKVLGAASGAWRALAVSGATILLCASVVTQLTCVYGVSTTWHDRLRMLYPFEVEGLRGIYTTEERADFINQAAPAIRDALNGSNLFVVGHMPLLYFLAEATPATRKYWFVNNVFAAEEIFEDVESGIRKTGEVPVLVVADTWMLGAEGKKKLEGFISTFGYRMQQEIGNPERLGCQIWTTE